MRILATNRFIGPSTILTASSSVLSSSPYQIKNPDRSLKWRSSTATTAQTVRADLGGIYPVNGAGGADIKVIGAGALELYHEGDAGSPGASVFMGTFSAQDLATRVALLWPVLSSHRHWLFNFTNPTAVSDYAELGFASLGQYVEPSRDIHTPAGSRTNPTIVSPSGDGQKSFARRTRYAAGTWKWKPSHDTAVLAEMQAVEDVVGVDIPFFAAQDLTQTRMMWLCHLTSGVRYQYIDEGQQRLTAVEVGWEEAR